MQGLSRNLFDFLAAQLRAQTNPPERTASAASVRDQNQAADRSKGTDVATTEVAAQTLNAIRSGTQVAPVVALTQFMDGFDQLPPKALVALNAPSVQPKFPMMGAAETTPAQQVAPVEVATVQNGFELSSQNPIELSGHGRAETLAEHSPEPQPAGFSASLDDISGLVG